MDLDELPMRGQAGQTAQSLEKDAVFNFHKFCLANQGQFTQSANLADEAGWEAPEDSSLKNAGLSQVKKTVLEMPGGGSSFSETQVLRLRSDEPAMLLSFEEQFYRKAPASKKCILYSRVEYLKTCEAIGQMIGRPPDRNQSYPQRGAHFIYWQVDYMKQPAQVGCITTPQSSQLPYDGVILSLVIDQRSKAKIRASQPVSGAGAPPRHSSSK